MHTASTVVHLLQTDDTLHSVNTLVPCTYLLGYYGNDVLNSCYLLQTGDIRTHYTFSEHTGTFGDLCPSGSGHEVI